MNSQGNNGLSNNPIIVILGLLSTCLAFFVFVTGFDNLQQILGKINQGLGNSIECNSWNLAFDFRVYPSQENPNRDSCGNRFVWYFMESSTLERASNNYETLENFVADAFGIPGYQQWSGGCVWPNSPNIFFPSIGINTNEETKTIYTAIHPSKSISVHPCSTESLAIIGWKSPINGVVSISGFVNDLDANGGDGILWFIDKRTQPLAEGAFTDGGQQAFLDVTGSDNLKNITVTKNDFIYFIVHPNTSDFYDTTQIDIQLRLH